MGKLFVLGAWLMLIGITPLYGTQSPDFYSQSVLSHYFHVDVPSALINKKKIALVIDFLKENHFKPYEKNRCTCTKSYYGTFRFEKGGAKLLWVYRNNNVHSGVFAIFNSHLDVIYLNAHMGCLYDLEVRDFLHNGNDILMVTHGAGGTGTYTKLTDLITNKNGIPELKGSLLKEMRDCNIRCGTSTGTGVCIKCYTRNKDFKDLAHVLLANGHRAARIEITAEAKLKSTSVKPKERAEINAFLKRTYGITLDSALLNATTVMIENLNAPAIHVPSSCICPGYIAPGYAWPSIVSIR